MGNRFKQVVVSAAIFAERWFLPIVFFCLAAREFTTVWGLLFWNRRTATPLYIDVANHSILCLLGLFTSFLLLIARRVVAPPRDLKSILIPLGTTFFTVFYYTVNWFPQAMQRNLCPPVLRSALVTAGLACVLIGPAIALWGILYLGRSFGVVVAVRKVVLGGPYRWVRHPMYSGWVLICLGVALVNFSAAYFLITAVHVGLLVYRARLEETQLCEHSPEYREHMVRTGFIFPKVGRLFGI